MNRFQPFPRMSAAIVVLLLVSWLDAVSAQEGTGAGTDQVTQEGTGAGTDQATQEGTGNGLAEPPLPTVQHVMDHLDDLYRSGSSYSTMSMAVVTENWSRTLEMEAWTQGDDNALIVIRSPAREAGTATLRTEDGLWNYAPRADRLVRIPSGLLSDSWMGSHFTNDDLMRESSYVDDFDTSLSWIVEEDGTRYLLATMTPHPDAAVVYTRLEYRLTADQWIPVQADFFDGEERVRTFRYSNLTTVGSRTIPFVMEVIPLDKPEESTRVEYLTLELDTPVDDALFTPNGLRRAAQSQ